MAAITAAMVGELRAKTDAPMMECKKALTEADGDLQKAEEILRVKLGNRASKAASRVAAEGVVAAHIEGNVGSLIEINCETDFVTKNDAFLKLADTCAKLVAENSPVDVAQLLALPLENGTVDSLRSELIGKIGENMSIRRFQRFETTGKLASYLHGRRIGVIVEYEGNSHQVAEDIAMQIVAMKPVAVSSEQVSKELIEKERAIATLKAQESGKPQEVITKMVGGSVQKYLKEVSLLNQPFVKDSKQTVEQMLKLNNTVIRSFTLYAVGEGMEKRTNDFAAEVAAQVAAAQS